jgi:uncharacterized membrane protein YphA (DoxX/SURF4 family)
MTTLRILCAIFLGRNTVNLVRRFEVHFWILIGLLFLTASGSGAHTVARLLSERGEPISGSLMNVIEIGNISLVSVYILGGYLILLGIFTRGSSEGLAATS